MISLIFKKLISFLKILFCDAIFLIISNILLTYFVKKNFESSLCSIEILRKLSNLLIFLKLIIFFF